MNSGNARGANQTSNLGRDGRRRIPALFFPAILIGSRTIAHDEVCRGLYMFQPGSPVCASKLKGQNYGKRDLIHLQAAADWLAINPGVLRETPVRLLLDTEKKIERALRRCLITYRVKRGCYLIKIA